MMTPARITAALLCLGFGLAGSTASAQQPPAGDYTTVQIARHDAAAARIPTAAAIVHDPNCPYAHHNHAAPETALADAPPAPPAETVSVPTQPAYVDAADPYGFAAIINHYRAQAGLHPLAYDSSLSAWASQNNAAQCSQGIGHHVVPNCFQNCGWNYSSAQEAAVAWMNSSGHRQNMLTPSATRFGIAYGPGPYWTLNAR